MKKIKQLALLGLLAGILNPAWAIFPSNEENVMYAWFGDDDQYNPDFVAVIDFDPYSLNYGRLITTSPLSGLHAFGNEPHHAGLVKETKTLAVGGLLSVLSGQDEVFFYDVTNPLVPIFTRSLDVPNSYATDEFLNLSNGNFFVTMMGGATGGEPGRVAEFDKNGQLLKEWPNNPPADGFSPHGISIRPEVNLMVTTDFVVPASTIGGPIVVQNKVRIWDLSKREIINAVSMPNAGGTMDIQLIPRDAKKRAVVPGQGGKLWLVNTVAGSAKPVFDFTKVLGQGNTPIPHIVKFTADGKRMFVSLYGSSSVAMFDSTFPDFPVLLSVVALGQNAGPHYIRLTKDEKRLVVTDYFLNEHHHSGGLVLQDGDRKIHVLNIDPLFRLFMKKDLRFNFNGNTAFSTGPARPHAVVFNSK